MKIVTFFILVCLPFSIYSSYTGYVVNTNPSGSLTNPLPGTLGVFSTSNNQFDTSVPLPQFLPFSFPPVLPPSPGLVIPNDPNNPTAYIVTNTVTPTGSNLFHSGVISVDLTNLTNQAFISVSQPLNILLPPTQSSPAYISPANLLDGSPNAALTLLDTSNNTITSVPLPDNGNGVYYPGIAINSTGSTLYLSYSELTSGPYNFNLVLVDLANFPNPSPSDFTFIPINSNWIAGNVVVTPVGQPAYAYLTSSEDSTLNPFLTIVNLTTTPASVTNLPLPNNQTLVGPLAITPDGSQVYMTTSLGVAVLDTATNTFTTTIPLNTSTSQAVSVAITPDGLFAYVTMQNTVDNVVNEGSVIPIDIATQTVVPTPSPIGTGGYIPTLIAFAPFTETVVLDANPLAGPASGGTLITLTGVGFTGTTSVLFGSNPATFQLLSDNTIVAVSPPGEPGTVVPITVFTTHGRSRPSARCCHLYLPSTFAPTHLRGRQVKNEFATQTDRVNIIRWSPPAKGDEPVSYQIYRDQDLKDLVATIPANEELEFNDHNRKKRPYTYYIVSVNRFGHHSTPERVVVLPN